MALDLNHGIYVRRGGVSYFHSSYTHAISPAVAFRVGGVTRYCRLVSGGSYLKVRRNGTTYGISGGSAIVTVTCNFLNLPSMWTDCSIGINSNGFASAATITVVVSTLLREETRTFNIPANQTTASETSSKPLSTGKRTVNVTISVFGRTYTGSGSGSTSDTSISVSVPVS